MSLQNIPSRSLEDVGLHLELFSDCSAWRSPGLGVFTITELRGGIGGSGNFLLESEARVTIPSPTASDCAIGFGFIPLFPDTGKVFMSPKIKK